MVYDFPKFNEFRDVMVANAHQNPGLEAVKTFDLGYLVAVAGFLVFINGLPVLEFVVHGNPYVKLCLGEDSKQPLTSLMMIGLSFSLLLFSFTIMISLRTRRNLLKLQDHHFENLPSQNVLTYLDTQMLCFVLLFQFISVSVFHYVSMLGGFSSELKNYLVNITQILVTNLLMSFIFPIYIILKTRRYLPKLWNDASPMMIKNNDFFADRIPQVSPE